MMMVAIMMIADYDDNHIGRSYDTTDEKWLKKNTTNMVSPTLCQSPKESVFRVFTPTFIKHRCFVLIEQNGK